MKQEPQNDIYLMAQVAQGDHQAFSLLVRKYTSSSYAIAYRYVADRTIAEDMTQQAFLKIWEKPYHFDPKRGVQFKTWFTQVLINVCLDYKRKNKHIMTNVEEVQIESDTAEAGQILYQKQLSNLLEESINRLPPAQQTALNLGVYQELPYEEVAGIMKTTKAAVQSLIMRAKENIRKYIKEKLPC